MVNEVRNYFINANSSKGWASFYDSNFGTLRTAICLHGWPSALAAELLGSVCRAAQEEDLGAELIHSCIDNSMEGVILPGLSAGVVNEPVFAGYNSQRLLCCEELDAAMAALSGARELFASALKIHDGWEKIYLERMDFQLLDDLFAQTADQLIPRVLPKEGREVHRFFGAATVGGALDYIPNLTRGLERRIFLKGRPGTGKSTLLKRLVQRALSSGYDCEVYHCSFDPNSLDMLILRELSLCIFDSTAPHQYEPERRGDTILDLYAAAVEPGTDEACAAELAASAAAYKAQIGRATESLIVAKRHLDNSAQKLCADISMDHFCSMRDEILQKLFG